MKFRPLFLLLAAFVGNLVAPIASAQLAPASERIVVVISLDGLAHYYFDDPKAEMPTIRQLAKEGARAEKMKAVLPTVTWPNHTTLVTGVRPGKHGVVGNSFFDRKKNKVVTLLWDPELDKEEIVRVPTVYDLARRAHLKTAAICWPGSRGARTLDWTLPLVNSNELFYAYGTPSLWAEFEAAGISYSAEAEGFLTGRGEERDSTHVDMFNEILRKHRPNLALLHILEVDHVEHAKGPQSPEAYRAVKFADECVRRVRDELQASFPGKATLLVVSDHGFLPFQQTVQPNILLRKEGLLVTAAKKVTKARVRAVGGGGATFLYVLDDANRQALVEQTQKLFQSVEGVESVLTEADFAKYGVAAPSVNPQAPDLILCAKEGYSFSDGVSTDLVVTPKSELIRGSHGYDPNLPKLHASFVAWGAGIRAGVNLGTIENTCVAPTIASLLGLEIKDAEGHPLREALDEHVPAK